MALLKTINAESASKIKMSSKKPRTVKCLVIRDPNYVHRPRKPSKNPTTLAHLPDDIFREVFKYLDFDTIWALCLTCKATCPVAIELRNKTIFRYNILPHNFERENAEECRRQILTLCKKDELEVGGGLVFGAPLKLEAARALKAMDCVCSRTMALMVA